MGCAWVSTDRLARIGCPLADVLLCPPRYFEWGDPVVLSLRTRVGRGREGKLQIRLHGIRDGRLLWSSRATSHVSWAPNPLSWPTVSVPSLLFHLAYC